MQLLSAASLSPEAQRLLEDFRRITPHEWQVAFAIQAAVGLVLGVLALWIASNVFSRERAGLGKAILTTLGWFVGGVVVALLAGGAAYLAANRGSGFMVTASLVIGVILAIYVSFSVPMRIYKIGVLATIGLLLAATILQAAGGLALSQFSGGGMPALRMQRDFLKRFIELPPPQRAEILAALRLPGASGGKTIEQRHAELQQMYADLQTQRAALRDGDTVALDTYNRENARYVELLQQLQRDAAAQPAPTTP